MMEDTRIADRSVPNPETGCVEWMGARNGRGYGNIGVAGTTLEVHRYAWTLAHGSVPTGLVVMHTCDNRLCVNLDHLVVGTKKANTADMWRKGRARPPFGQAHSKAKLTADDVAAIRRDERSQYVLARVYGVHPSTINQARTGRNWKSVP